MGGPVGKRSKKKRVEKKPKEKGHSLSSLLKTTRGAPRADRQPEYERRGGDDMPPIYVDGE